MRRSVVNKIVALLFLFTTVLFAEVPNEVVNKNPNTKVEKILADKNREKAYLNITVNKLNPQKIEPIDISGGNAVFSIPKGKGNYTYFITEREEEIPHKLKVNNKDVETGVTYTGDAKQHIGYEYEILQGNEYNPNNEDVDILKVPSSQFKKKVVFIAVYDKDEQDVTKLYSYERRIRRPRSYIDLPNRGTVYLGVIRAGAGFHERYKIVEGLWWFYKAEGGKEWGNVSVKNIDQLNVDPLNRKFLNRLFLGSSFDFLGRATFVNMNYDTPGNPPISQDISKIKMQVPVSITLNEGQKISIQRKTIGEEYLDNGYYPGWSAKGVLSIPPIKSFWRHGVFQETNIWYEIYGQIEYKFEDKEYVAGMYEIDNSNGSIFNITIGHDLSSSNEIRSNVMNKIHFLLQRGTFKSKATVKKQELTTLNGGKLVNFSKFKGYLKEKYDENILNDQRKSLFYAEYGGNYTVETKKDNTRDGITVNRTREESSSGIIIPEQLGTGLYTIDLRYQNEYGDYLQYDPKGGNDNYDTFLIEYLDNRPDSKATIDLSGLNKGTYGIWDKDASGTANSKKTNATKNLVLNIENNGQVINTLNTNSMTKPKTQKVGKLKVTRLSDGQVFEKNFDVVGQTAIIDVEDVSFGFESNGDFKIQKNAIVPGQETYDIEAFDSNDVPLGKMNLRVIKDAVENVGDIKYDIDKLLIDTNLDGWLKLDGSYNSNPAQKSNKLLEKMLKESSGSANSATLGKLDIKKILSVGDYRIESNGEDFLLKSRSYITSIGNNDIYSSSSDKSDSAIYINKVSKQNIGELLELHLRKNEISTGQKVIKVIYLDSSDKYKSFRLILNTVENTYHILKYDVNMTDFQTTQTYQFDLTSRNIDIKGEISEKTNPNLKIRKTEGNPIINGKLQGFRTAFNELNLEDVTLKINEVTKTDKNSLSYSSLNNNYTLKFEKYLNTQSNIDGLNLFVDKQRTEFQQEKVTLKYLYKDLIPLGEIELTLNSSNSPLVYGEGILNLSGLKVLLKENPNNISEGTFWYFKLAPYSQDGSSVSMKEDKFYYSDGINQYIRSFKELPWSGKNYKPDKGNIGIVNGKFYKFSNGSSIINLDKVTIEKDGKIIDEFQANNSEFTIDGIKPTEKAKNYLDKNLIFAVSKNGELHIGGRYNNEYSGIYRLNFYEKNVKKGEFLLHVYEKPDDKPLPTTKSEDTLIIEIDKRIKQLFNTNDIFYLYLLPSKEVRFVAAKKPNGDRIFNVQTDKKEFYDLKTQKNDQISLDSLLDFLKNVNKNNFKTTKDLIFTGSMYNDTSGNAAINFSGPTGFIQPIFMMYKKDFESTDEIERNMFYKDGSTEKAIKVIIRFVGDDKKTIDVPVDVSKANLKDKIQALYTLNIPDLIIFDKSVIYSASPNFEFSLKSKTETPREYVKVVENKQSKQLTFDVYRYTKAFITEERVYSIKYYGIEMQDIRFNIINKGTEGRASIDMSSRNTGVWDNFIEKTPKSNTLIGDRNVFTLKNIEGDIIDTRIFTGKDYLTIENNSKKIELSDDKGSKVTSDVNADGKGKIQARLGALQIGIEGTDTNKYTGFLFMDKKDRDYIPKVITIVAKDEKNNILSRFILDTIVDNPKSLGKITLNISGKLYQHMFNNSLMFIDKSGKIASNLAGLDTGKDYSKFVKLDLSQLGNENITSNISWKHEIPGRTRIDTSNKYSKKQSSDEGFELPSISTFANIKNGTTLPKAFLELDSEGKQTDKLTILANGVVPYSFEYEIVKGNDDVQEIEGSINTFTIPENKKAVFSSTAKTVDGVTFDISDFISIVSPYYLTGYSVSDYKFVNKNQDTVGEAEKEFSIYKFNMLYTNKSKNEIAINKKNNSYVEQFQEIFDLYYKDIKLGTYYLKFENTPPVYNGSAKLDLTDFTTSSSATFKIKADGTLEKSSGDNYSFTEINGKFPYANMTKDKLEILVRKKGDNTLQGVTLNSTNGFVYTDSINSTPVLKLEFNSENNNPTIKVSKLSDLNDPKSSSATYEIIFSYKNGTTTKNLGKYDLMVVRNEKDLGVLKLRAKPYKVINTLSKQDNGKYKIIDNGIFNKNWEVTEFTNKNIADTIKVKEWLTINNVSKSTNQKFEFSNIETTTGAKKENIEIVADPSKNIVELIKGMTYKYMIPDKTKASTITFTDQSGKFYKIAVEYDYELFEKQTASGKLTMTELAPGNYEFTFRKNSSNSEITEDNNKKDNKQQTVQLTEVSGYFDISNFIGSDYRMSIINNDKQITSGINGYKYTGSNYDIELLGSKVKITKKSDGGFEDNLVIRVENVSGTNSTVLMEFNLILKSETKFAIKGDKILDFGVIAYSPFDTTHFARGEKTFTIIGAKGKELDFRLPDNPNNPKGATMTHTNGHNTINVRNISIKDSTKNDINSDEDIFTMEAFAETTPNMIPGEYTGEVDVIIDIVP